MPVPASSVEGVARLLLAIFFLFSGGSKLVDVAGFVRIAVSYRLFRGRERSVRLLAFLLPVTELVAGALLVFDVFPRPVLFYLLVSLVGYTVLLAVQLLWGGRMENCGCYGTVVPVRVSWWQVAKNLVLIVVTALLLL